MKHNTNLDGFRGLSCLLIFVLHTYAGPRETGWWPQHALLPITVWDQIFLPMQAGVELFFMISGVLIIGTLLEKGNVRTFLWNRILRIYPVFTVIQILIAIAGPLIGYRFYHGIGPGAWAAIFGVDMLMLPGLIDFPAAQPIAWSLSYEFAFYAFAACLFVGIARLGRRSAVVIAVPVCVLLIWLYPRGAFFLTGVTIYFWGWAIVDAVPRAVFALCPLLIFPFLYLAYLATHIGDVVVSHGLTLAALGISIPFFASITFDRGVATAILRTAFMRYMGRISYSFYLWHIVVMFVTKRAVDIAMGPAPSVFKVLLFGAVTLPIALGISQVSYALLEIRLSKAVRNWAKARKPAPQPV